MESIASAMSTTLQSMVIMVAKMTAVEEHKHGEMLEAVGEKMGEFSATGDFGLILAAIDSVLGDDWEHRSPGADEQNVARSRFIGVVAKMREDMAAAKLAETDEEVTVDAEEHGDPTDQVP